MHFEQLAAQWRVERPRGVDIDEMTDTPAYRAVIGMGASAIRPILLQLRRKPEHWFRALHQITHVDPVPASAQGNLKQMTAAWLEWGKAQGCVGELD